MEKKNILNLYPEDFENFTIWEDICDVLNISYDCNGIEVEFKQAEAIENDN